MVSNLKAEKEQLFNLIDDLGRFREAAVQRIREIDRELLQQPTLIPPSPCYHEDMHCWRDFKTMTEISECKRCGMRWMYAFGNRR